MDDFHFIRPLWLVAIIGLVWALWQLRKLRISSSAWHQVIPKHLSTLLLSSDEDKKPVSLIPAALIGLLMIVALAGPTWQKIPQPVFDVERGSVLVMDMSLSMLATDIKPDRLTMARYKAMDLVERIDEGEVGLVAYAGDAFTISPLTSDINNIKLLLPSLSPMIMPELGSNPYPALILANQMLNNAGHIEGDIYWITDGISQDEISDINNFASEHNHRINILAVGTADGAPITLSNGELMKDRGGNIVIPKLVSGRLAGISRTSSGIFSLISADDSDLVNLSQLPQAKAAEKQSMEENMGDSWHEAGPYLLLLALPFLLTYFRRGVLFTPVLLAGILAFSMQVPNAQANIIDDLFKTQDQQAQQKFNDGNYQQAAEQFKNPTWQASSLYKSGDYEAALEAYQKLELSEQNVGVDATYNKANTLAKLQQFEQAINAYEQVLEQQPQHNDALANKAIVEQLLEQQQQQEQQDQEQNDQQQDEQDQQDDQQEQQQGDQDQSEQQGDQQDQQNSDQQSDSNQQDENSESQENSEADQNPDEQESEQQSRDNEQQNAEQDDSEQQQDAGAQQDNSQQTDEQSAQQQQLGMTEEEKAAQAEEEQKYQQLLRQVTDDPHLLLKNKMLLEQRNRRRNRSSIGVKEKW
ncbi:vWA domain-containing protein [Thalassotalea crassostreae]|uniref:vWA domain-containing protein n=1 Tax=Thalassotalea crassostreae TaxID=1763536 RepID=UPI000A6F096E|nr:VWA domain-containing protein [Thalassotalea crassostreae]